MGLLRVESLPDEALRPPPAAFHADMLPKVRAALAEAPEYLTLIFAPGDHTHVGWRLAAVQQMARESVPVRVNAVASDDEGRDWRRCRLHRGGRRADRSVAGARWQWRGASAIYRRMIKPAPLIDQFQRRISYLRLSVTDRCDLRCAYCMPERMTFLPRKDVLSLEELHDLALGFIARGYHQDSPDRAANRWFGAT